MQRTKKKPSDRREELELWFPVVVRYGGFVLAFALVVATILGYGLEVAAGYVLALGMISYKTVKDAASNGT